MQKRFLVPVSFSFLAGLLVYTGCTNHSPAPVAPYQGSTLSISIPAGKELSANLLGAASNEILYRITGPGMSPVSGTAGPFSAPGNTGSLDLTVTIPPGTSRLLALQLNNASNHQPLALGAALFDFNPPGSGTVTVNLGPVGSNCYSVDTSLLANGSYFSFENDSLADATTATSTGYDILLNPASGGFQIRDAQGAANVAYLGNGNLVNFAAAPSAGYFSSSGAAKQAAGIATTILQASDVYCCQFAGGGHAWLQVINPGSASFGPSFRFRVNTNVPYFSYEQTNADIHGTCLSPLSTPTSTLTPTSSPTQTATPTPTPTITGTPTNTTSPVLTQTPTATPTLTVTPTITTSPLPTQTPTVTPSGTPTPTVAYPDITGNIDGASVSGDTSGQPDGHSVMVNGDNWGTGAPDLVYKFTLTGQKRLFFNLCNANFDTVLYLCTDPNNPSSTLVDLADDSQYCAGGSLQTTLATGLLTPGTYYVVVDGFSPGNFGPFVLSITSFLPTAALTPTAVPAAEAEPNNDDTYFTQTTSLGTLGWAASWPEPGTRSITWMRWIHGVSPLPMMER